MHELALSQQMAGIVSRAAAGRRVRVVQVEVGQLRQVVPEALTTAWGFVVLRTPLAGADLQITVTPAVLRCRDCGQDSQLEASLGFNCRGCNSRRTTVLSGDEFRVLAIEVDD